MSLAERIEKDYLEAYKARLSDRVGVLRLLKTAMKNRLVELRRPGGRLSDEEALDVILRQAKQRQDSIDQYNAVNRPDLAEKEARELKELSAYLPEPLDAESLDQAIRSAIARLGAKGPQDMGKVIGQVMGEFRGRVDGGQVSARARELLRQE